MQQHLLCQTLFNATPSLLVELAGKDKTALYSLLDVEVILASGDKTIKELADNCPIEVWEGCNGK